MNHSSLPKQPKEIDRRSTIQISGNAADILDVVVVHTKLSRMQVIDAVLNSMEIEEIIDLIRKSGIKPTRKGRPKLSIFTRTEEIANNG